MREYLKSCMAEKCSQIIRQGMLAMKAQIRELQKLKHYMDSKNWIQKQTYIQSSVHSNEHEKAVVFEEK